MSPLATHLRNYAELGRVSNLPTTLTNTLTGCALGVGASGGLSWPRALGVWLAIACFYIAGMALNDLVDEPIDRVERPQRPIPSGRVSRRAAGVFIAILFVIGLAVLGAIGVPSLAAGAILVGTIIAYDFLHTALPGSVVLMGLCRGLVYIVGAVAVSWPADWNSLSLFAGAITLYTILFTIIARSETHAQLDRRRWLAALLPLIAASPILVVRPIAWQTAAPALIIVLAWLVHATRFVFMSPPQTRRAVMAWLAGFCLIDGLYLALLHHPFAVALAAAAFILTALGQRRILGS